MAENRDYIGYAMFKQITSRHTTVPDGKCVKIKFFFSNIVFFGSDQSGFRFLAILRGVISCYGRYLTDGSVALLYLIEIAKLSILLSYQIIGVNSQQYVLYGL